jgi:D-glycero-D-manno-heptose 1,7-bisphosphate phosphatase
MKAIFLDRDGTLNRDLGYLCDFEKFEVLPGVVDALRILRDLGYRLFVVSNQSGVARRYFTGEAVEDFNRRTLEWFRSQGVEIVEAIYCPHHVEGIDPRFSKECDCRKPMPGMILELARKHSIDLASSYMIGDKRIDAETGVNAGAAGVWLRHPDGLYSEPGRVDNAGNIKEFLSLLDFAEYLREFEGRTSRRDG